MTIILYVRNAYDDAMLTINTMRIIAGSETEEVNLIVFDNASDDGFNEWASAQEDFTYVYMDEGYIPCGKAINLLVKELDLKDFILLNAGSMPVPGMISSLTRVKNNNEKAAVVSGMSNLASGEALVSECKDYESFAMLLAGRNETKTAHILAPYTDGCLISIEGFFERNGFDEELENLQNVIIDYSLRCNLSGTMILLDKTTGIWKKTGNYADNMNDEFAKMSQKWNTHYFNISENPYITGLVTKNVKPDMNVLEIGCDMGATLLAIKNKCPDAHCYGIDINETAVKVAGCFSETKVADIENDEKLFGEINFDYIIFGDVLEHLRNPEAALANARKMLKSDGKIVISVPNLMHISVMKQLLNGDFTYTETGLLDKTHIHLFTYNELMKMIRSVGGNVCFSGRVSLPLSRKEEEMIEKLINLGNNTNRDMYATYQYVVQVEFDN